jgi:hypothetical protein
MGMKYTNYTWNTGHLLRHDSDVDLDPVVRPIVIKLLAAGSGQVPGSASVFYRFTEDGKAAVLSVSDAFGCPLWISFFFLSRQTADQAMTDAQQLNVPSAPNLPSLLACPGLLTVFLPSASVAQIPTADIYMLADFAKTMFVVWGTNQK